MLQNPKLVKKPTNRFRSQVIIAISAMTGIWFNAAYATSSSNEVFSLELAKAVDASDKIKAERQGYLSARENLVIAQNGQELSATLSASHKYAEISINGADFGESNNREVAVTVKRNLFDGGLSSAEETVAMLQLDMAEAKVKIAEDSILTSAINAYTGLVTAANQLRISQSNVARLEEHLRAAEIQLQVGESTETQLAGTKARLARAKAGLIQSETALANAEANYEIIIGPKLADMTLPPIAADLPITAMEAGDQALQFNANHHVARLTERISRKNMDVLVAQVKPNVDFSLVGKTVDNTLTTRDSEEVSASINFSMPLYPTSSVRAKSRGVVADHRQALFNLQDNRQATRLAAENAFRTYSANTAVIAAYEAELDAAIAVRNGTEQEVQFGEKTILDLLDAEQDVVSAQLGLTEAKRDQINASYALKSAIGKLYADDLGLNGTGTLIDEPAIESPLVGPYPRLIYPE